MKIKIDTARNLLESKLKQLGLTTKEARIVAGEYLLGELKDKKSHGIFNFPFGYKKKQKHGHFRVVKNKPAFAYIEGNKDYGQIVADYAINLAIKKSRQSGIALVGGGNIQAFLRPGTWAEVAAKAGMVALCFNYGGGPLVAPTGAREPILSTNPIGIGIPYKPFPIVLDMAISERAFYHIRLARLLGKKIDPSWGIDKSGKATIDPNKLIAANPLGGYKGYGLALALEILTGPLVHTAVGKSTKKVRGFLFIVINPLTFTSKKQFDLGVNKLIHDIKTAKKIKGIKEILIPGERAYQHEQENLKRGYFEIDEKIINGIKKL